MKCAVFLKTFISGDLYHIFWQFVRKRRETHQFVNGFQIDNNTRLDPGLARSCNFIMFNRQNMKAQSLGCIVMSNISNELLEHQADIKDDGTTKER